MNRIRLQDLTPSIYYNHSRDFQFIGRLYDIVLNSVKTNSELLYHIPLDSNTDSKLIDLMTLTLGFKSKHDYNIKQLTSLCSAFTTIIKNKGSKYAIKLAIAALLNAEGIKENFEVIVENYTVYILVPQTLSDLNLLKDLLLYILPAGMGCEISRTFLVNKEGTTELTTKDSLDLYEGIYLDNDKKTVKLADSSAKSVVPHVVKNAYTEQLLKSTPGIIGNIGVYQPTSTYNYNIIYITNGGKLEITKETKFTYSHKNFTPITELPKTTWNDGTTHNTWYKDADCTQTISEITEEDIKDKADIILYTKKN